MNHAVPSADLPQTADLLVVGAGTMGVWTAFWAQLGGGRSVTLVDAWGAGNSRSSSGDENRIIRSAHGDDALYTRWSRRAREHWLRFQDEWHERLFVDCGVLWFGHRQGGFEERSAKTMRDAGVPNEILTPDELRRRWPQLGTADGMALAVYEPESGALMARRACQATANAFRRAGGRYGIAAVRPGRSNGSRLNEVVDEDGRVLSADTFVFACGPWLPRLFPDALGTLIRATKQDVLYVGPHGGDSRFDADALPAWADYDAAYYGVPSIEERGFKIAPDRYGPIFDPSAGERVVDPESIRLARRYLRQRFPDLADAPVVETRVCTYESTADGNFVIDRHPGFDNVWIAGGGSGHGFKHGPRIGEYLLARLNGASEGEQEGADETRFRVAPRVPGSAARTGGDSMASAWDLF